MEVHIATAEETKKLSKLSVSLGNVPFFRDQSIISVLEHEGKIVGFAAVQNALHAAGSWIEEKHRLQKHSYELRHALDNELRTRGFAVYFAMPKNDFEKHLFAKYGLVTEDRIQIRHL
jgi:hypothetical protein